MRWCLSCLLVLIAAASARAEGLTAEQRQSVQAWLAQDGAERAKPDALGLPVGLSADDAAASLTTIWEIYQATIKDAELPDLPPTLTELVQKAEGGRVRLRAGQLTLGEITMPYVVIRRETEAPKEAGRALFICTHGGGGNGKVDGPHAWPVNTREWQTQVQFAARHYQPEGVYFVPRMADDRKGRWFHGFNHTAFERVIEHAIAHWGVDPNRVYMLGISQGGFGTNKLVTFMPDRFAGANPMAGGVSPDQHPPANLRNVAFRNDVGEKDTMFDRVGNAIKFHKRLDELHAQDPDGYTHMLNVQKGKGHGIDYRPGVAWIAQHTRTPWPSKLVWDSRELGGERRSRHYWVELSDIGEAKRTMVVAAADREANTITLTAHQLGGTPKDGVEPGEPVSLKGAKIRVLLHDSLVDLDQPVRIVCNSKQVFMGKAHCDAATLLRSLASYGDPSMAASAEVVFVLDE